MKILLIGEFSNLHSTLAAGLKLLGHDVTVVSDGGGWMENDRDVDLFRLGYDFYNSIKYLGKVHTTFRKFKNYDIVQIHNPSFLNLNIQRNLYFYRYLLKNNEKVFLGAFGSDYFWEKSCAENKVLRYSDLFIGNTPLEIYKCSWIGTQFEDANIEIAESCNGIVSCLYEYHKSYEPYYKDKLEYIPLPINTDILQYKQKGIDDNKIKVFIGIQKLKTKLKGTDILHKVLLDIHKSYPNEVLINKVESVPLSQYEKIMAESDVLVDQLYSYTPGMNGLIAMAQGLILVGGGEPEMYELLNEKNNFPIVNVYPTKEDVYEKLENLILNRNNIPEISYASRKFIEDHHNYIKVAKQYVYFWNSK